MNYGRYQKTKMENFHSRQLVDDPDDHRCCRRHNLWIFSKDVEKLRKQSVDSERNYVYLVSGRSLSKNAQIPHSASHNFEYYQRDRQFRFEFVRSVVD